MEDIKVTASSGNIFADMGLPEPGESLAKADVAIRIEEVMAERGLTQVQAARLMGLTQPQVSNIVRGRVGSFTLDKLFACLNALDIEIEIVMLPKVVTSGTARVKVVRGTCWRSGISDNNYATTIVRNVAVEDSVDIEWSGTSILREFAGMLPPVITEATYA